MEFKIKQNPFRLKIQRGFVYGLKRGRLITEPALASFHIKMLYIQICFFNEKLKDLLESLFIFSIKCSFFKAVYIKHSQ